MPDVNFGDLLNVQVQSVVRPPTFPAGHYQAVVIGHEFGESSQKKTPYVQFNTKIISPHEDVDEDLFEKAGGQEALDKRKRTLKHTFYLTEDAYYRLREFLENGLKLNCSGRNFDEVIPEADNCSYLAKIKLDPGEKEGEYYMNIADYAAIG